MEFKPRIENEPFFERARLKQRAAGLIVTLSVILNPTVAHAQEWFTRESCDIASISATAPDYVKALESALSVKNDAVLPDNGIGKLWRVTTDEDKVSYLWGSFHSSAAPIVDLPEPLLRILSDVKRVYLEKSSSGMTRQQLHDYNNRKRWNNVFTARHWTHKLDPVVRPWVTARLAYWGVSDKDQIYLRATEAAELMLFDPCEDFNLHRFPVQDVFIEMLATHRGADVIGLEPLDALDKAAYGFWNNKLPISIINVYGTYLAPADSERELATARRVAFELYRRGELGLMMELDKRYVLRQLGADSGPDHFERAQEYLLHKRNRNFIKKFFAALADGENLIATGAFHLPGEFGLVELLRDRGMVVDRVILGGETDR